MCTGTAKLYARCNHKRISFAQKCILLELPVSQDSHRGGEIHGYVCPVGTWLNDPVKMSGFCSVCTLKENTRNNREEKRKGVEKWIEESKLTKLIPRAPPEHRLISKAVDKERKNQVSKNLKLSEKVQANYEAVKEEDWRIGINLDKRGLKFPALKEGLVAPVVEAGTELTVDEDEDYENIASDEEWSLVERAGLT